MSGAAVNKKKLVALENSITCYGVTSIILQNYQSTCYTLEINLDHAAKQGCYER